MNEGLWIFTGIVIGILATCIVIDQLTVMRRRKEVLNHIRDRILLP